MSAVGGAEAREKVVARGSFRCPREKRDADYVVKQVVLDDRKLGEFVLCRSCGLEFAPKVLSSPSDVPMTSLHEAFSLLFSAMIIADGVIKEPEMTMAKQLLRRFELDYDMDVLTSESERVKGDLAEVLREASEHLSLAHRRLLLEGAISIATADKEFRVEERELIENAGRHMGFTRSGIAELLDGERQRQDALRSFLDEWGDDGKPVSDEEVASMAERFNL